MLFICYTDESGSDSDGGESTSSSFSSLSDFVVEMQTADLSSELITSIVNNCRRNSYI